MYMDNYKNINYMNKYLKYKIKYLKLKNKQYGGNDKIIMKLNDPYFDQIESNDKTIEGRLYDEKRQKLKIGDIIEFKHQTDNSKEPYTKKITKLEVFIDKKFNDVINKDNYKLMIPNAKTKEDAIKVYNKIYSEDKQKQCGVVLIHFSDNSPE